MTIVLTKANRWRFEILPRLFGVILLTGICVGTVHLLGVLAIYFVPMYVVSQQSLFTMLVGHSTAIHPACDLRFADVMDVTPLVFDGGDVLVIGEFSVGGSLATDERTQNVIDC